MRLDRASVPTPEEPFDPEPVIDEPLIPTRATDLERWWPEPAAPSRPALVPFGFAPDLPSEHQLPSIEAKRAANARARRELSHSAASLTRSTTLVPRSTSAVPRSFSASSLARQITQRPTVPIGILVNDAKGAQRSSRPSTTPATQRPLTLSGRDPSTVQPSPNEVQFPGPPQDPNINQTARANKLTGTLESLDTSTRLAHWMNAFVADEHSFASKAVFVEMRLRQALQSSAALGVPNTFRAAVVCDAFERVAPLTGRYEGVLALIWREIMRAVFFDYTHDLPGSGARAYAERTPYFVEAQRQRQAAEQLREQVKIDHARRVKEAEQAKAKGNLLNKTLGRSAFTRPSLADYLPTVDNGYLPLYPACWVMVVTCCKCRARPPFSIGSAGVVRPDLIVPSLSAPLWLIR